MNQSDLTRNQYMLHGKLARNGYDWWWHSFTGYHHETGEAKAFYIEFFVINPEVSPDKIIYGQLEENKKNKLQPSYVCVNVGTWGDNARQLHNFYLTNDLEVRNDPLNVVVGDCVLSEIYTKGSVYVTSGEVKEHPEYMSDAGSMKWELSIDKKIAFNVGYGASKLFRMLNAFEMYWHAEGMKTEYSGVVELDGEQYDIIPEKSYGYADKNWGSDFTSPWVWISSCHMKSLISGEELMNSVIDVGGGRPKAFGIGLPRKLLINFYYEGEDIEFNFSMPWTGARTQFDCYETENEIHWKVATQNWNYILKIRAHCKKEDMLLINYEAPNGKKLHNRLWNGGNGEGEMLLYKKCGKELELIDKIKMYNMGCEYGEYGK